MPNNFKNNNSARQFSWSARSQRRHLHERARISVEEISTHAVFATAEPQRNLGGPSTIADVLHGPHFTRSYHYRRINLVWDQLGLVDGHEDMDSMDDLPQRAPNVAHIVLTWAGKSLSKVLQTHVCDQLGVSTSAEAP